ncbi:hypothetical protein ACR79U_24195, partial [Sphingobacterium siyangense]
WESRSVPFFTRKPLLETVKGFFRLDTSVFPCTGYCLSSYWLSQHMVVGGPGPSEAVPQPSLSCSSHCPGVVMVHSHSRWSCSLYCAPVLCCTVVAKWHCHPNTHRWIVVQPIAVLPPSLRAADSIAFHQCPIAIYR